MPDGGAVGQQFIVHVERVVIQKFIRSQVTNVSSAKIGFHFKYFKVLATR